MPQRLSVYDSLDQIGADRASDAKAEIPYRFPPSEAELVERGLIKRLVHKLPGDTDLEVIARCRPKTWWRAIAEVRPYSTARFWIFLLGRSAACN